MQTNIAILASGGGSNADVIIKHFKNHPSIKVVLVVSNNAKAGVLAKADEQNIPCFIYKSLEDDGTLLLKTLRAYSVNFIVLAGYLKKIPEKVIYYFPDKIVNIHPSLLPKHGGKGMYGMNVHKAVVDAKDNETGMTIHFVNQHYDEGKIIEQHKVSLDGEESAEQVAAKVLKLEHTYFAPCIEKIISNGI